MRNEIDSKRFQQISNSSIKTFLPKIVVKKKQRLYSKKSNFEISYKRAPDQIKIDKIMKNKRTELRKYQNSIRYHQIKLQSEEYLHSIQSKSETSLGSIVTPRKRRNMHRRTSISKTDQKEDNFDGEKKKGICEEKFCVDFEK